MSGFAIGAAVVGVAGAVYSANKMASTTKAAGSKQAKTIAAQAEADRENQLIQRRADENAQFYQNAVNTLQQSAAAKQTAGANGATGVSHEALYAAGISFAVIGGLGLVLARRRR